MDYGSIGGQTGSLEAGYNNYNASGIREDVYVPRECGTGAGELQQIPVGKAFRGEVTDMTGNQVTIRLENGKSVQARLAEPVSLNIGEQLMFQVKSNQDGMIEIRPLLNAMQGQEATILKALQAAGLPVNDRTVVLLQNLLKEQMPINRESLQNMYKLVLSNRGADVASLVEMQKHGIPVTKENIAQFEAYKNYEHRISAETQKLSGELVRMLGEFAVEDGEKGQNYHMRLLELILPQAGETDTGVLSGQDTGSVGSDNLGQDPSLPVTDAAIPEQEELQAEDAALRLGDKTKEPVVSSGIEVDAEHIFETKEAFSDGQVGKELSVSDRQSLAQALKDFPLSVQEKQQIINGEISVDKLLEHIYQSIERGEADAKPLMQNGAYGRLIQGRLSRQWLVTPEQLAQSREMQEFYGKLSRHAGQIEQMLAEAGRQDSAAAKTAGGLKENIDFMNQINQLFNYVQIPLMMSGKTAHSDLYVFTKKKQLQQQEGKVSALLHLDMEALGSLDIYVEMDGMKIDTQFKVADAQLVQMFQQHMDFLQKRICEKGYQFSSSVEIAQKKVDFVQDFLEQDHANVPMQRFAFDVRA